MSDSTGLAAALVEMHNQLTTVVEPAVKDLGQRVAAIEAQLLELRAYVAVLARQQEATRG